MRYRILRLLVGLIAFTAVPRAQRTFTKVDPTEIIESLKFDVNTIPVNDNVVEHSRGGSGGNAVDLNFSPNVVILSDSETAFVSYSGSDKVMVFNPKTGEILGFFEVGSNPGLITLSPDGKTLAVICVHVHENLPSRESQGAKIGSIVLIDSESFQTRTLNLSEVFLSVANNVVFSVDGKTGFVPSMGTDELIRFDVDSLEEIAPRLQFTPGIRPAGASVVPGSGLLAVVLSGSTNVNRSEHPDAIAFIDPGTFEVTEEVSPKTGREYEDEDGNFEVLHNFTGFTNFSISPDGKYGLIADQQLSALSSLPEFSSDRAWLFDFETREFSGPIFVGGVAAGCYYAPDGQFVVVSPFIVTLIDPKHVDIDPEVSDEGSEIIGRLITPTRSDFRVGSRPAFTHDGQLMYLASPSEDSVLVVDMESGEITNVIDVGGGVERRTAGTVDGETKTSVVKYPSGPLDLGLTPDGEVITVLNFNENTVELLKNTLRFFVPRVVSTYPAEGEEDRDVFFTALALSNLPSSEAEVVVSAYSRGGILFADDRTTEDIVEIENPSTIMIPGKEQKFNTLEELLSIPPDSNAPGGGSEENQDEGDHDQEHETFSIDAIVTGWLDVSVDQSGVAGAFFIGDRGLTRLDGSPLVSELSNRILIPEVEVRNDILTEVSVVNPHLTIKTVNVELINHRGQLVERYTRQVAPKGMISEFVGSPESGELSIPVMFQAPVFEPCHEIPGQEDEDQTQDEDEDDSDDALHCGFEKGYIIVTTGEGDEGDEQRTLGVAAYEHYFDNDRMAAVKGLPLPDQPSAALKHYAPQIVAFEGCSTFLKLINPTKEWLNLDLYLKDDQGQDLAPPANLTLRSGHSVRPNVVDLFGLTDPGALLTGWLLVEADGPGLMGDVELQLFAGKAMTTVPLTAAPSKELVFPYVPGKGLFPGLGLVNTENESANVTIEVVSADGVLVHETNILLAPKARVSQMLAHFANEFGEQNGAYLRVISDKALVGLELFFTGDLEVVSSVLPQ